MTIRTLTHIHKLLRQEERRTENEYKEARRGQHVLEEEAPEDKAGIKLLTATADRLMKEHSAALDALLEFERQEW